MIPFTKKYAASSFKDIRGQDAAIAQLKDFVLNFKKQKKKALLLYGPSGTGKTTSVHALAHDVGLEIVEVNASDTRNKENINDIVGNYSKQGSLFARKKLIMIDEIDGLNIKDRGAVSEIIKVIDYEFI